MALGVRPQLRVAFNIINFAALQNKWVEPVNQKQLSKRQTMELKEEWCFKKKKKIIYGKHL